jgi:hypothetical protein
MKTIIALASLLLAGCIQDSSEDKVKVDSIPSLNIWIGGLPENRHAAILVQDSRYYDPSITIEAYEGRATWSSPKPAGLFEVYAHADMDLVRFGESCVFPDSTVTEWPEHYRRNREFSYWWKNGEEFVLLNSRPEMCHASGRLDSAIAKGQVLPTMYIADTTVNIDAKGFAYARSIEYYYQSTLKGWISKPTATYSVEAGGYLIGASPFLGRYTLYH